jgi:hypothetical protein
MSYPYMDGIQVFKTDLDHEAEKPDNSCFAEETDNSLCFLSLDLVFTSLVNSPWLNISCALKYHDFC